MQSFLRFKIGSSIGDERVDFLDMFPRVVQNIQYLVSLSFGTCIKKRSVNNVTT